MALTKNDNPEKVTDAQAKDAVEDLIDAGAGAPPEQREAAEDLPEKDPVQKAVKAAMLAEDAQTEAKEKAKVVKESPDAPETPSGFALLKTAGIADDVKRGEEYSRIKSAMRHGYVPASTSDLEAKK